MALFDFLKEKNKAEQHAEATTLERPEADINKTQLVADLLKIPRDKRDDNWRTSFYDNVRTASFACGNPQVITGPDDFPYFVLKTPEANKSFESFCIQNMKDDFLLEKGWGIIFNPAGDNADWVFSYGDIVNLHLNNEFISEPANVDIQNIEMSKKAQILKKDEQVMIARPSEKYLPKYTREALKKFLLNTGLKRPMVMMLSRKSEGRMIQELAFNVYPEDFSSVEEIDYRMKQIGWFLPRHYLIVSFSKNSGMEKNLAEL